jgi:hypothetical protein
MLTPEQQQLRKQRTRLVAIGAQLAATAVEHYGYCSAGCVLSDRPCRLPCAVVREIDRRVVAALKQVRRAPEGHSPATVVRRRRKER